MLCAAVVASLVLCESCNAFGFLFAFVMMDDEKSKTTEHLECVRLC